MILPLLQNQTQFVKIWAIASCADLTGQCLVSAVIALLRFDKQFSQPFADFVCAELARNELVTATVENCEDSFDDAVVASLVLAGVYLVAKAAAVGIIFAHFTALRAAMSKVVYPGYEWNQSVEEDKDGGLAPSRSSTASFTPPRRRRSSSGSSVSSGGCSARSDSLPAYSPAQIEAGEHHASPSNRRKSHTFSSSHSHSHRPRLVLVPVFAHDSMASPSSSHGHSPSSALPPLYAFDAPIYSPSGSSSSSRSRSSSSGSHQSYSPLPHWHEISEGRSFSTRRMSHGPFAGAPMGRPVHGSFFGVTATTDEPETYIDMASPELSSVEPSRQDRKTSMEI